MLHCFECGADLPDNIVYCLQCGKPLGAEEETVVRPKPFDPWLIDPKPVEPIPVIEPEPVLAKRQGSGTATLILGVLLGAGLVIGMLIVGAFMFASNHTDQTKINLPVNIQMPTQNSSTPTTTPTHKPTPTPTVAPSNSNTN